MDTGRHACVQSERQNEAYQAMLPPFTSSGRLGINLPLMTSWRKPFERRRSRCVRDRFLARMAAVPLEVWSFPRISRDGASFSEGVAMPLPN